MYKTCKRAWIIPLLARATLEGTPNWLRLSLGELIVFYWHIKNLSELTYFFCFNLPKIKLRIKELNLACEIEFSKHKSCEYLFFQHS